MSLQGPHSFPPRRAYGPGFVTEAWGFHPGLKGEVMKKDLAQIIRDNPGCTAVIDNDCWTLHKVDPYGPDAIDQDAVSYEEYSRWQDNNTLATDEDVEPLGDGGYGSGNCYGGDILQALAAIVGIKIQSV